MREKFKFKYILWAAIVLQLIVDGFVIGKLIGMNVVPVLYLVIMIVCLIAVNVLTFFSSRKLWAGIVMLIISLALSAVMIYGFDVINKADSTVNNVSQDSDKQVTEMVIVVLDDSEVQEISDLKEFLVGYLNDSDIEASQSMLDQIKEAAGDISAAEFGGITEAVNALYDKTINALVMNKAYIAVLAETEEYSDFEQRIKQVYSSEIVRYINIIPEQETNLDAFIVYFTGIDTFGGVTATSRSDVNILAVVNTKTRHIQLINTPRDYYVELPNSGGTKDKLTHAGIYGVDNSIGALEMLYGIDVDYYVRINFSGFEQIIDALGGIDVYSEYDFTVEPIKHYTVGINHLSGIEALAFARERYSFAEGDVARGKNQMAVITALIQELSSPEILYNYTSVLNSISQSFQTNMQSENIYALVKRALSSSKGWTVDSYSVAGEGAYAETYSIPGMEVYVMRPDMSDVNEAKAKIEAVLSEN